MPVKSFFPWSTRLKINKKASATMTGLFNLKWQESQCLNGPKQHFLSLGSDSNRGKNKIISSAKKPIVRVAQFALVYYRKYSIQWRRFSP